MGLANFLANPSGHPVGGQIILSNSAIAKNKSRHLLCEACVLSNVINGNLLHIIQRTHNQECQILYLHTYVPRITIWYTLRGLKIKKKVLVYFKAIQYIL
jgi:hypothetical protein